MTVRAAVLALVIVAGLAAQEARSKIEVIRASRCDGGSTTKFDTDRVERNYRDAATALQRALSSFEKKAVAKLADGHDAGLPDPERKLRRTWKPSQRLPEQIRGTTIHVVTIDRNGIISGLPQRALAKTDVVFVSRAARLTDCAQLAPLTLMTRDLAAALGIRSSRCRCSVSADGSEIEIVEGDQR